MEQLFKHEGMCVWTEEEYAFMKNARKAWPKGCANTYTTGNPRGWCTREDGIPVFLAAIAGGVRGDQ